MNKGEKSQEAIVASAIDHEKHALEAKEGKHTANLIAKDKKGQRGFYDVRQQRRDFMKPRQEKNKRKRGLLLG